jgi:predicted amidohydrolase YtcJ
MRSRLAAVVLAIIAASVGASGQRRVGTPPDAVFFNGKVVTVDGHFAIQQAFAVGGDTFTAVGTNQTIRAMAAKSTHVVDLHGHAVIPGLGDNHDHVYDSAKIMLRGVSLEGVGTVSEALDRIREAVARARPGQTVFTSALLLPQAEQSRLTIRELDQVSTTVPIVVFRGRLGAALVNGAALRSAGITRESSSFFGVPVPKDASGELTGETLPGGFTVPAYRAAMSLLDRVVPAATDDEEEELLLRAIHQRNALGLTSVRDVNLSPQAMRAYFRLWRKSALTLRVSMGLWVLDAEHFEAALGDWGVSSGFGDTWLRVDSISELPTPDFMDRRAFTAVALAANRYGWRLAPHIAGVNLDNLNAALDAYEAADRVHSIRDKRWVLEHVLYPTPEQMERMVKLGVVVSAQYGGFGSVPIPAQALAAGPQRMRDLLDHHLIVSAGSDFLGGQSSSDNPFIPIYFYVTRRTSQGDVINGGQKISREEALRVSTNNYAYMTFEEKVKGSIESGKLADFLILSDDILTVPEEKILSIHPLATYVGGRKVYAMDGGGF